MCVHFLPLTNTMYFFKCVNKDIIIIIDLEAKNVVFMYR